MTVPDWWETVILGAAAWRVFHLLAFDDILDRPRRYVTRLDPRWKQEGDPTGMRYREGLANFLTCPYCLGAYSAAGWWVAWLVFPSETLFLAGLMALMAGVIAAQRLLSSA